MWDIIHHKLNRMNGPRFPVPASKGSNTTFRELFDDAEGKREPAMIIFDEADKLTSQTPQTIAKFLQEIRNILHSPSSLSGVALLGTHQLLKVVEHRNWSNDRSMSPFDAVRCPSAQSSVCSRHSDNGKSLTWSVCCSFTVTGKAVAAPEFQRRQPPAGRDHNTTEA